MERKLTAAVAALQSVCQTLGIARTQLGAVETADNLNHTFPVNGSQLAQLNLTQARAFSDSFGDAGRIEIRLGDLTELSLDPTLTESSLEALVQRARTTAGSYDVTVTVNKLALAEAVGLSSGMPQRMFLYGDALVRSLRRGLARFESEVWPDAAVPLLIIVADTDVQLIGPRLAVVGGRTVDEGLDGPHFPSTPQTDAVREAREQHIGWEHDWTRELTPWHFELYGTSSDPVLQGLLHTQLIKLAVLFTCDRARAVQQDVPPALLRAEYRGREHVAVIPIDETQSVETSAAQLDAVLGAVSWCYRSADSGEPQWLSDRLPFLQTRIAQVLEPHPEADRLSALVRAMPYVIEGVEWQWKAFIEGKVSTYLEQVQQVENAVTDTVSSFGDRTSSLVKTLTESLLAAVAVLIGSFIAAAYKDPFNASLFRIGMRAYAGYVLIFPGLIGLSAAWYTLGLTVTGFDARIARFKEVVYPEKVDEVVGSRVVNARRGFKTWVTIAAIVYVAVAVGAWIAADQVPKHLVHVETTAHQAQELIQSR